MGGGGGSWKSERLGILRKRDNTFLARPWPLWSTLILEDIERPSPEHYIPLNFIHSIYFSHPGMSFR